MPESCLSSLKALLVFSMRSMAKDSCHAVTLLGLSGFVRPCMVSLNAYVICSRPLRTCLQNDALFIHCSRDTENKSHKARSWINQQAMQRLYSHNLFLIAISLITVQWTQWLDLLTIRSIRLYWEDTQIPQSDNWQNASILSFLGRARLNSAFRSFAIVMTHDYRCSWSRCALAWHYQRKRSKQHEIPRPTFVDKEQDDRAQQVRQQGQQDRPLNALQSIFRQQLVSLYWQGQDDMPTKWDWLCLDIKAGSWSAQNTLLSLCNCLPDIQPVANSNGISMNKGATTWLHMAVQVFLKVELGRANASFSIDMTCRWNSCQLPAWLWRHFVRNSLKALILSASIHYAERMFTRQLLYTTNRNCITLQNHWWTTVINNIDRAKHLTSTATV